MNGGYGVCEGCVRGVQLGVQLGVYDTYIQPLHH